MKKTINILFSSMLLFSLQLSHGEESINMAAEPDKASTNDPRVLVSIPDPVREFMRKEMRSHLNTLNAIIGYLGANDLEAAAYIAETNLGRSSMGKHKDLAIRPGMYMTPDMKNIAWGMHAAATEFAITAKKGDLQSSYSALQKITTSCVSCHSSFRTQ